ncbi:MAG: CDP-diacylglycerol--serine O-phosphatidyltransferase [Clostridiales bacterium]|nr:CDP-diacylglycerol--serine O-phosphatidyltransferase [Clostridiales bacterium]
MEEQEVYSKNQKLKIVRNLPNLVTLLNLSFGILVIFICICNNTRENRVIASVFILASCICDAIDGPLARKLDVASDIGKQLDSFADIISFGVSPMVLAARSLITDMQQPVTHLIVFLAMISYISCGILRLVRYNLGDFRDHFVGLPITVAGLILAINFLLANHLEYEQAAPFLPISVILIFVLSALMISNIRVSRISLRL